MRRKAISLLSGLLSVMLCNSAWSAITIVPPGLRAGDMYHLVFVTDGTRDATSSDIAVYNTFVNDEADLVPELSGFTWFAIASTESVDARDNAFVEATVYTVSGLKVAEGFADLWDGVISVDITTTQLGGYYDGPVWTGTAHPGVSSSNGALGSLSGLAVLAEPDAVQRLCFSWTECLQADTQLHFPLYALSAKLTMAVPEPSSHACAWFMLLCAGMAYGWQRFAGRHSRAPCRGQPPRTALDVLDQITSF